MLYAVFCYHAEDEVFSWNRQQEEAVIGKLVAAQVPMARSGKLGPVARLQPTTSAVTVRTDKDGPLVIDGPFAETKEQLLGFYVIDCASLEEAIAFVKELDAANPGGAHEIRPMLILNDNKLAK